MTVGKLRSNPSTLQRYGYALLLTGLASAVRILLMGGAASRLTYTPFIVAVILACWYGGLGPALVTTVLGMLIGGYYAPDLAASRPGGYLRSPYVES